MAKRKIDKADFSFRDGYRPPGGKLDPQSVGEELERLRKKHDGLETATVIEEAKPAKSPIHNGFTWDNAKAAQKCREVEARNLVRSVEVVYPDAKDEPPRQVYVHIPTADSAESKQGRYEAVAMVLTDEDMFQRAYEYLVAKMNGAVAAVADLDRAARKTKSPERLAVLAMVVKAVQAATEAVKTLSASA